MITIECDIEALASNRTSLISKRILDRRRLHYCM